MEVKIGVQNASRELVIDTDVTGDEIQSTISKAIAGEDALIVLTDAKGRKVMVPTDKVAYIELGSPSVGQVGFRS